MATTLNVTKKSAKPPPLHAHQGALGIEAGAAANAKVTMFFTAL